MKIELFHTLGCGKCAGAKDDLKAAAEDIIPGITWRELDVLDELDYAIELGVVTLPSIAIDGEVVFSSLPTCGQLRRELAKRKTG